MRRAEELAHCVSCCEIIGRSRMMPTTNQDSFADGLSKFAEAARHSMTASRLAAAGTMAIGAATYLYFADPERREAAIKSATRMYEDMTSWWHGPSGNRSGTQSTTE